MTGLCETTCWLKIRFLITFPVTATLTPRLELNKTNMIGDTYWTRNCPRCLWNVSLRSCCLLTQTVSLIIPPWLKETFGCSVGFLWIIPHIFLPFVFNFLLFSIFLPLLFLFFATAHKLILRITVFFFVFFSVLCWFFSYGKMALHDLNHYLMLDQIILILWYYCYPGLHTACRSIWWANKLMLEI